MDPKSVAFPAKESISLINVVTGGKLYRNVPCMMTFVPTDTTKADLPNLIPNPNPGEFAAKYGIGTSWQWDGSEWQEV